VTGVRPSLGRRHGAVLAACVLAIVACGLASHVFATGAAAATVHSAKFFGAVVPDIPTGGHPPRGPIARAANLPYGGGPVMHSNRTHVIFWTPSGSGLQYDPGYVALVERFMRDVAADSHKPTNVYGLSGQYDDHTGVAAYNSTFAGAVATTDPLPPNECASPATGPGWTVCLSDAQLENEIRRVVSVNRLPTGTMRDVYILVLPNGMGTCETTGPENCALGGMSVAGSFCGYHSTTPDEAILYAVIPYNAVNGHCQSGNPRPNSSTADPTISTISHEHNETVTDPLGTGWIDGAGNENGDLCIQQYGPVLGGSGAAAWNQSIHGGHYFLQEEWSNVNASCQPRAQPDSVSFGAPARVSARTDLTLTGRGRASHGRIVRFDWTFGDGGKASRRTTQHGYKRPGNYTIVLRTTDSWGNWAFATRAVRVTQARSKNSGRPGQHRK
jgi:hypothetical protein